MMGLRPAALVAAAIAALVAPSAANAQLPTQDSVTGFAATGLGRFAVDFTFDARSGPSGENPTGTVSFDSLLIDLGALEVSCLTVSGNRASMIVLIGAPPPAPAGVAISVEDNDGAAQDRVAWDFLSTLPTGCPVTGLVGEPILAGDVTVTDAQPLPTTKAQCNAGGWRSYGVFENRRECVRFVRRGARQECIFIRAAVGREAFRAQFGSGIHKRHAMRHCVRERMSD